MRGALIAVAAAITLFSGAAIAQSDDAARLAGNVYSWSLAVGEGQCREHWRFGTDNVLIVQSGEEVTTSTFALAPAADSSMFELRTTRLTGNGLPDCQGASTTEVGQANLVYLVFLNGGGFFTCANTNTLSCYGVATPIARRD